MGVMEGSAKLSNTIQSRMRAITKYLNRQYHNIIEMRKRLAKNLVTVSEGQFDISKYKVNEIKLDTLLNIAVSLYNDEEVKINEIEKLFYRKDDIASKSTEELITMLVGKSKNYAILYREIDMRQEFFNYSFDGATDVCNEREYTKEKEYRAYNLKYPGRLQKWVDILNVRYAKVSEKSTDIEGSVAAPAFIDRVVRDIGGYIPFVTDNNFIYTTTFYNVVMGNIQKTSVTSIRRVFSIMNKRDRYTRIKAASILQHIIGLKKSLKVTSLNKNTILDTKYSLVEVRVLRALNSLSSNNTLRETRPLAPSYLRLDFDAVIMEENLHWKRASRARKSVKSILYRRYGTLLSEYFYKLEKGDIDKLEEEADVVLLEELGIVGDFGLLEDVKEAAEYNSFERTGTEENAEDVKVNYIKKSNDIKEV